MSEVFQQIAAGESRKATVKCAVETGGGKEGVSRKDVGNDGERTIYAGDVGVFSPRRSRVKRFRELDEEEKQAGIQGQWQQESPAREYLEQVKCCHDTDCNEPTMKTGFTALKNGTWEEFKDTFRKKIKASEWAFDRIEEAFELAAQDEAEKMSIVQEIMLRSTDFFLPRIIVPVGEQGGVTMSYLCSSATVSFWKTTHGGSLVENPRSGGAQFVEKSTIASNRTGFWSHKQVIVLSRPRCSKHMQYLKACAQI